MKFRLQYIVNLNSKNIELLDELDRKIFRGEPLYPKDTPHTKWWFVFSGSKGSPLVGFAGLTVYPNGIAFLCRSGILPKYRGHGLHLRLIRVREVYARKIGLTRLITYTNVSNISSANNLIRLGFTLYRPHRAWGLPHKEALYFSKTLGE